MMMTLPQYEIRVEQQFNDDLRLVGTAEQIKNLIDLLLNNNLTTFSVQSYVPVIQQIGLS